MVAQMADNPAMLESMIEQNPQLQQAMQVRTGFAFTWSKLLLLLVLVLFVLVSVHACACACACAIM